VSGILIPFIIILDSHTEVAGKDMRVFDVYMTKMKSIGKSVDVVLGIAISFFAELREIFGEYKGFVRWRSGF
jgi:hypothetical protein